MDQWSGLFYIFNLLRSRRENMSDNMEERKKLDELKKKIKLTDKIRIIFLMATIGLLAVSYFFMQEGAVPLILVQCAILTAVATIILVAVKFVLIIRHNAIVKALK